jgi:hypothetical protein
MLTSKTALDVDQGKTVDEPLIFTSKGNLPIASLTYETEWEVNDNFIKFVERYRLDGEVVKEGAHVYDRRGVCATGLIGS